jgi:hypothetical protein
LENLIGGKAPDFEMIRQKTGKFCRRLVTIRVIGAKVRASGILLVAAAGVQGNGSG